MKKHFFLAALLIILQSLTAQTDGMLWKISGKGLGRPSYLFGTIHFHCHPDSIRKPVLVSALASASVVAMELNLNEMNVLMEIYQHTIKNNGTSLQKILGPTEYLLADSVCKVYLNEPLINHDNNTPLELMGKIMLSEKFAGCQGVPVDFTIAGMAKANHQPMIGLETFRFQDSLLNTIPLEIQSGWLTDFCRHPDSARTDLRDLLQAYDQKKSNELYRLQIESSPEFKYLNDALLIQRNKKWVQYLAADIRNNNYFIAVGAAHLGGKDGLIELFRKQGYTVTPVPF